jgi:hypothetical protein
MYSSLLQSRSELRILLQLYSPGPPLWSSGHSSWLQIHNSGFDSRSYRIFWEIVCLERGPLSLVSTTEELLGRKSSSSGLETRDYGRRVPSRSISNFGTNFADKRQSLGRYSLLADSSHGVFYIPQKYWFSSTGLHTVITQQIKICVRRGLRWVMELRTCSNTRFCLQTVLVKIICMIRCKWQKLRCNKRQEKETGPKSGNWTSLANDVVQLLNFEIFLKNLREFIDSLNDYWQFVEEFVYQEVQ